MGCALRSRSRRCCTTPSPRESPRPSRRRRRSSRRQTARVASGRRLVLLRRAPVRGPPPPTLRGSELKMGVGSELKMGREPRRLAAAAEAVWAADACTESVTIYDGDAVYSKNTGDLSVSLGSTCTTHQRRPCMQSPRQLDFQRHSRSRSHGRSSCLGAFTGGGDASLSHMRCPCPTLVRRAALVVADAMLTRSDALLRALQPQAISLSTSLKIAQAG